MVNVGQWGGVVPWPVIGLHALITPDGRVLTFGTDQTGVQSGLHVYDVWNPVTNTHVTLEHTTYSDLFCSVAMIVPETGQVLISGGDARPYGNVNNGIPDVNLFDYRDDSLTTSPSGQMAFSRWYPTSITLGTGQILTIGGRDEAGGFIGHPEIYTPGYGWRTLTGAYIDDYVAIANYPRTWLASSGKVYSFAPQGGISSVFEIDTNGIGSVRVAAALPTAITGDLPSIMFAPDKALLIGDDGSTWVMDMSGANPVFTRTGDIGTDRKYSNLVVLPDGHVMIAGGSAVSNQLIGVNTGVAIWDPATGTWSQGPNEALARLYHSTALLLPDGTVLSAGGGAPGPLLNTNAEIYKPGYLFDADGHTAVRPTIVDAPSLLEVGQDFTMHVGNPSAVASLVLMPFGTTTHTFNMASQRIVLPFTVQADGTLAVDLPNNANVLTPGYWMLFALDAAGTPSAASTVRINSELPYDLPAQLPLDLDVGMVLNGKAAHDAMMDAYSLVPDAPFRRGSVMSSERVDLTKSFDISFQINLGNSDAGGDGMAFVLHNDPAGAHAIGGGGGSLGAIGIARGLGLEFDVYQNSDLTSDIANDHAVFFDTDNLSANPSVSAVTDLGNIEDGAWHNVRVSATGQSISYWFDGVLRTTLQADLAATYFGGSSLAYFGFTGATGGAIVEPLVRIMSLSGTLETGDVLSADRAEVPRAPTFDTGGDAVYAAALKSFTLTPDQTFKRGAAFSHERVDMRQHFDITFEINVGPVDSGGDGMAFVLHNDPAGSHAIGGTGGSLGATGILNGLGIEFDTYRNPELTSDIANDHSAFFDTDNLGANPTVSAVTDLGNIENGHWQAVRVSWDGQAIRYWVNGTLASALTSDIAATYLGGSPFAYFGFTAATGGVTAADKVRILSLNATAEDGAALHMLGRNSVPVGVADSYTMTAGTTFRVSAANGVLVNDTDREGDTLRICQDSRIIGHNPNDIPLRPAHGSVQMQRDGSFIYTPVAGFVGQDSFFYCVEDGPNCVKGNVTITVGVAQNLPPAVTGPIAIAVTEDSATSTYDLLAGASDPEGGALSLRSLTGVVAGLALGGDGRTLTVVPTDASFQSLGAGATRVITLGYDITDPGNATVHQTATVRVTGVNDGPVATADAGLQTQSNASITIQAATLLANDRDVDIGDVLSITSVQGAVNGTVALSASGAVTFTPRTGYAGAASFTYTITDGHGGSATARADLNVAYNTITGTNAAQTLTGTAAADRIDAMGGNDTILAAAGDDLIIGGAGRDTASGGDGNDTFLAGANDGNDVYNGNAGLDTYDLSGISGAVVVRLGTAAGAVGTGQATGSLIGSDTLNSIESVIGGSGADTLTGDSLANVIVGGDGADILTGFGGNDLLTGGIGNDMFVFRTGFGGDTLTDFSVGTAANHDTLDLRGLGFTSVANILANIDAGPNAVLHAGVSTITLSGVTLSALQASPYVFVF